MLIRSFSEITNGAAYDLDEWRCSRAAVIDFAEQYDPQPWHLDDEGARANPLFGRIAASGWHILLILNGMTSRFWTERTGVKGMAGGGLGNARWIAPVFVGDVVHGRLTINDARISKTKPEMGIVEMHLDAMVAGTTAVTLDLTGLFYTDKASV